MPRHDLHGSLQCQRRWLFVSKRAIALRGTNHSRNQSTGYTLIEVLITAIVVLLAITGMMTMQMMSIKTAQDAYHRTQATTLAYQMTDALRAKCAAPNVSADALDEYVGHTLCEAGNRADADNRQCEYDEDSDTAYDPDTDSAADHDYNGWWTAIHDANLPPWFATIQRSAGTDNMFHIVIQWQDKRIVEAEEVIAGSNENGNSNVVSCLAGLPNGDIPSGMVEICLTTIPCAL